MKSVKVGDIFPTNGNGQVEVLEYNGYYDVKVKHIGEFGGHIATVNVASLKGGRVKNPYKPVLYNVGYVGVGEYARSENQRDTKVYATWRDMLRRCYCDKSLSKRETYRGCSVVDHWHNFQNFAHWYYQQPNAGKHGFQLDKDLRILNNKIYGPETCSFVPSHINSLLTDRAAERSEYGQGVHKHYKGYKVHISLGENKKTLGTYETPERARAVYKKAK